MLKQAALICDAMSVMFSTGVGRTGGNVSARLDDERFLITPSGAAGELMGRLAPNDLPSVALGGGSVGDRKPSSETAVHAAMYRVLSWATGIVHAHPLYTLTLSENVAEWPSATSSSRWFPGSVFSLPSTDPMSLEEALGGLGDVSGTRYGVALFVPRHGLFVAGESVSRALYFANKIEENAHLAFLMARPAR